MKYVFKGRSDGDAGLLRTADIDLRSSDGVQALAAYTDRLLERHRPVELTVYEALESGLNMLATLRNGMVTEGAVC